MKKYLALILCLVMCLSMVLVGCDKEEAAKELQELAGKTPEELYNASLEALKEAGSFSCETTQKIEMTYGDQTMTMNQTVISKQNGYDMYMKSTNDTAPSAEMEVTYVDGVYYLNQAGRKTKQEISHEQMDDLYESLYGSSMAESTLLNIPADWFNDITFKQDGSYYTLTFMVSGEKYTELMGNAGIAGASFEEDVQYVVYFTTDGTLEKVVTTFDFEIMGVEAHCVSTGLVVIGDVTITAPADADTYT